MSILKTYRPRTAVDALALLVSAVASPFLILPAFAFLTTWHYSPSVRLFLWWSFIAVGFSTGVPLLHIVIGVRTGMITDVHVMRRDQRTGPFLVAMASSAVGAAVLHLAGAPMPIVVMGLGIAVNGVVFALITLRWKISMHPSVYVAAVWCAVFLISYRYVWLLLLLPAVVWARSRRSRHSVAQGIAAILVATAVTLGVLGSFGFLH